MKIPGIIDDNGNQIDFVDKGAPHVETANVGDVIAVKAVDENGVPTEWEAINVPKVKINGVETEDNNIPIARQGSLGAVMRYTAEGGGVTIDSVGAIQIARATDAQIDERINRYQPIVPFNLEHAVTSVIDIKPGESIKKQVLEPSDLEHYVKDTDYATQDVGGVVRMSSSLGTQLGSTGVLQGSTRSLSSYETGSNNTIISKGTLENVLADRIKQNVFIIQEEDLEVSYDDTKGVAPYSSSYGYTNIVIKADAGIKWIDGAIYLFNLSNNLATSANRNGRIKIEGEDIWHPITASSGSILSSHSYLIKNVNQYFKYSTRYFDYGALTVMTDNNTTYTYLVNTVVGDATDSPITIDSNGYGARYSLIFPTTPISDLNEKYSSLVKSQSISSNKVATSGKFYIDRTPLHVYSANINAGDKAVNQVYQYYTGMDVRYTANTTAAYVTRSKKCFLWLKNFDEYDMTFESDATVGNIMTIDRLATRFPSTMTEDVYLYFLGWTQANWYQITPNTTDMLTFYKYVPSTQTLTKITPKGLTDGYRLYEKIGEWTITEEVDRWSSGAILTDYFSVMAIVKTPTTSYTGVIRFGILVGSGFQLLSNSLQILSTSENTGWWEWEEIAKNTRMMKRRGGSTSYTADIPKSDDRNLYGVFVNAENGTNLIPSGTVIELYAKKKMYK